MGGASGSQATETYDGSSWTTQPGTLNTARNNCAGNGTTGAALAVGGRPGFLAITESYDGTSWAEVADLSTGRSLLISGSATTLNSAIVFAGEKPAKANETEEWNGSAWTEVANLSAARKEVAGGGTQSLGFCAGGSPSVTTVEEWTKAQNVKTITD